MKKTPPLIISKKMIPLIPVQHASEASSIVRWWCPIFYPLDRGDGYASHDSPRDCISTQLVFS